MTIFADAEALRAIERGSLDEAAERLRHGPWSEGTAEPFELAVLDGLDWWEIERLGSLDMQDRDVLSDALVSLSDGSSGPGMNGAAGLCLVVGSEGGGSPPGVHVGFSDPAYSGRLRSKTAPSVRLEHVVRPRAAAFLDQGAWSAVLRPGPGSASLERAPAPGRLLHGLLSLGGDEPWAVTVSLTALSVETIEEEIAACERCIDALATRGTVTEQLRPTMSVQRRNAARDRLEEDLEARLDYLRGTLVEGAWELSVFFAGTSSETERLLPGALKDVLEGSPLRFTTDVLAPRPGSPPAASLLSSRDVGGLFRAPAVSLGRLEVVAPMPGGKTVLRSDRPIQLGTYSGTTEAFTAGMEDVVAHGLSLGVTGGGKTTTSRRLVTEAHRHGVPILVIDPASPGDYRKLADVIGGPVTVLSGSQLHLNFMQPWPGYPPALHLSHVVSFLCASFPMPPPVPQALAVIADQMADSLSYGPLPTVHDMLAAAPDVIRRLGYDADVERNAIAAIEARLGVLVSPEWAECFAAADSSQFFDSYYEDPPFVIELSDLDPEKQGFAMGILFTYVTEAAKMREPTEEVAHLTVLEEAHLILPEPRSEGVSELSGDPRQGASRLGCSMLPVSRARGEFFWVVTQSPASLAREAVRNTNLKIVHRIVDPADREVAAGTLGLRLDEAGCIGSLKDGEALITTRRRRSPETVTISLPEPQARKGTSHSEVRVPEPPRRPCCGVSDAHHYAERKAKEAQAAIGVVMATRLAGRDPRPAIAIARRAVERLSAGRPSAPARCLVYVGTRQMLRSLVGFGVLEPSRVEGSLAEVLASWEDDSFLEALVTEVSEAARAHPGVSPVCSGCPMRCMLRHFVSAGSLGATAALRRRLDTEPVRFAVTTIASSITSESHRLAPLLGPTGAIAAALCCAVHAAQASGLPEHLVSEAAVIAGRSEDPREPDAQEERASPSGTKRARQKGS